MVESSVTPVEDTVPRVDELAVGEDLVFQRRWWRFERAIWGVFLVVILCDLVGLLGHGWLAEAKTSTPDGALTIDYERIERGSSPSTMTLHFGQTAIHDGHVQVFVSDSVVKDLGAQRISPQPAVSAIGAGGLTYLFPAVRGPADVQFQLEPTEPGTHRFRISVPGEPAIDARVFVLP
jgi:hypothetical protein